MPKVSVLKPRSLVFQAKPGMGHKVGGGEAGEEPEATSRKARGGGPQALRLLSTELAAHTCAHFQSQLEPLHAWGTHYFRNSLLPEEALYIVIQP